MKTGLDRLWRVRALLEEVAKAKLQRQAAAAARVEQARRQAADLEKRLHGQSLCHLSRPALSAGCERGAESLEDAANRHLAVQVRECGRPGRELLGRIASREAARLSELGEEFLVRRTERRQMGTLLDLAAERRRVETLRREQRDLDDWYVISRRRQAVDSRKP